MAIFTALILFLLGGVINGSFALPTKHVYKWKFENIWLQFCIWTFLIIPWIVAYFVAPQIFTIYAKAPPVIFKVMLIGGLVFGIGQICFALAINMIGIGLAFVVNLGLSIMLGFLLPLVIQHPGQILTPFGVITLIGCIFAVIGLLLSNRAGNLHHKEQHELRSPEMRRRSIYAVGAVLAVVAGLSSAGQNFAFSFTSQMQQFALHLGTRPVGAATIMWPGFLLCSFIPYALYMLFLHFKNKSFKNYTTSGTGKYYLYAIIMGIFYYGSVVCYSRGSQLIGSLGPLVGWPLFMVLIILVSNFWGWRSGEWAGCSAKVKHTMWLGLLFLVFSIIVLGYSSAFHT